MGKNQGHKAMQRSRYNGAGGAGDEAGGAAGSSDGLTDMSFHTAEWHAARIAALQVERMPWEEWRQKQKEAEGKLAAVADEEERLMQEYRTQLNADRAKLLARGRNHTDLAKELKKEKDSKKRKRKESKSDKKSKKSKKESKSSKKSKKSKRRRTGSDSGSDSSSSSSDSDDSDADGEGKNDPNKPMRLSDWLKM